MKIGQTDCPKSRYLTTNTGRVASQKSEDLIDTVEEAWNHEIYDLLGTSIFDFPFNPLCFFPPDSLYSIIKFADDFNGVSFMSHYVQTPLKGSR
jgi:hypothetical protein